MGTRPRTPRSSLRARAWLLPCPPREPLSCRGQGRSRPSPLAHAPMERSVLRLLLVVGAEVHQGVQVGLEKHVPQPGHVALEGGGTQELHDPPEGRHDREALVGDGGEGHDHGQLPLSVIPAAFQEGLHVLVHLRSKLVVVRELREAGAMLGSPAGSGWEVQTPALPLPQRVRQGQEAPSSVPCRAGGPRRLIFVTTLCPGPL